MSQKEKTEEQEEYLIFNNTEKAMIKFFSIFQNPATIISNNEYASTINGVNTKLPYHQSKRYSLAVVRNYSEQSNFTVYITGNSKKILQSCNKIMSDGQIIDLTSQEMSKINKNYKKYALEGNRIIAFALQKLDPKKFPTNFQFTFGDKFDFPQEEFVYLGFIALNCAIRPEAKQFVEKLKENNLRLIVLYIKFINYQFRTNEDHLTTTKLCEQCEVLESNGKNQMTFDCQKINFQDIYKDKQFQSWIKNQVVMFSRIEPEQKIQVLKACKKLRYSLAVTGENIMDLSCYKLADVSFSSLSSSIQPCIQASNITISEGSFLNTITAIIEAKRAHNNVLKSISLSLISCSLKIVSLIIYLIFGTPEFINQVTMLCISVGTDLLIGISFAREEYERPFNLKNQTMGAKFFIRSYGIIGMIMSAAGIFAYLSALNYFGFKFESITNTRLAYGFIPAQNSTYNVSSPYLGNSNLNFKNSQFFQYCEPYVDYFQVYKNLTIQYDWNNNTMNSWDQRMVFVQCTDCSNEQKKSYEIEYCWNPIRQYSTCLAKGDLQDICYTGNAIKYGQTSLFGNVVISSWINYLALRTSFYSYRHTKPNKLGFIGISVTIIYFLIIVYIPYVSDIFETQALPFILLGFQGVPFSMLILIMAEFQKFIERRVKK